MPVPKKKVCSIMQQSVLTLPPLSVLLKEGLKGALQGDISVNILSTTSSYSPILKTAPEAMNEPCEFPIQIKSDGNYGGRQGKDITDVTLFPRRKAGENHQEGGRGPVVLSVELLQSFYGMPLHVAAKKLVSRIFVHISDLYSPLISLCFREFARQPSRKYAGDGSFIQIISNRPKYTRFTDSAA